MSELAVLQRARKIGFLFSGGAARCAFQIGVIEVLSELGITPAACLGVSGGAWNAAAVSSGNASRLRAYWRFFNRMPYVDVRNMLREHSPFIWTRIHRRAFDRFIGEDALRQSDIPAIIALTRLQAREQLLIDVRHAADPFRVLVASNYLPPFYTHALDIDGEACGDGGFTNNIPYEVLFEHGCDAVVLMTMKGISEGGLFRNTDDYDHVIPEKYRDRVVLIRPRHRMPVRFVERRWERLSAIADLGAMRAREVLLDERYPETDIAAKGSALSIYAVRLRSALRHRLRPAS